MFELVIFGIIFSAFVIGTITYNVTTLLENKKQAKRKKELRGYPSGLPKGYTLSLSHGKGSYYINLPNEDCSLFVCLNTQDTSASHLTDEARLVAWRHFVQEENIKAVFEHVQSKLTMVS